MDLCIQEVVKAAKTLTVHLLYNGITTINGTLNFEPQPDVDL